MSSARRVVVCTVAFIAIESTVFTVGQFRGPARLTWWLSLLLALGLVAAVARELRSRPAATAFAGGRGLVAIVLSAVIAAGAFAVSVLIAMTATAWLGGRL